MFLKEGEKKSTIPDISHTLLCSPWKEEAKTLIYHDLTRYWLSAEQHQLTNALLVQLPWEPKHVSINHKWINYIHSREISDNILTEENLHCNCLVTNLQLSTFFLMRQRNLQGQTPRLQLMGFGSGFEGFLWGFCVFGFLFVLCGFLFACFLLSPYFKKRLIWKLVRMLQI